jgi:hypothetical protein
MLRKRELWAATLLLALLGCAGTKSEDGGGGGAATVSDPQIEAVFANRATGEIDPENIETGEQVQFRLTAKRADGTRVQVTPGLWQTSDTNSIYGVLAANTGIFLAGERATPTAQVVYTTFQGKTYSAYYRVNPRQVRLAGNLLNQSSSAGVGGVSILFYNDAGLSVGRVRTNSDGSFLASVPVDTASFQIEDASVPSTYFRSMVYDGVRYDTGRFECRAQIPAYDPGPRILPNDILLTPKDGGAKPEPDGCNPI